MWHFNSKGKLVGFSETPYGYFLGWCIVCTDFLGVIAWILFAPIATLALYYKNNAKSRWNPRKSPTPFIVINILWIIIWYGIISGKFSENFYKEHPKYNKEYVFDEQSGTWGFRDKNGEFSYHPFE